MTLLYSCRQGITNLQLPLDPAIIPNHGYWNPYRLV